MRTRKLDQLFDRYRRQGDLRALGELFDRTAPELLRVATSLVRDPAEADDVLQATFLTAIERAEHYDSSRRLLPWLLGILVNHTHELRRARARVVDPERLTSEPEPGPDAAAEAEELSEEVVRALARVSARHRVVLEPFLREGKRPVDIAREAGLAPGTVRMRLHRGLEQLRKALPAGLTLGAAAMAPTGRGLAAVRAEVLRVGSTDTAGLVAVGGGAASSTAVLGGILVGKNLVLAALGALVIGVLGWIFLFTGSTSPAVDPGLNAEHGVGAGRLPAGGRWARSGAELAPGIPSREDAEAEGLDAFEQALSGMSGRLLEHDGRPVVGVEVTLLEWYREFLRPSLSRILDGTVQVPEFEVARAITDEAGGFSLEGARPRGIHFLGIDLGGPRGDLRMIEVAKRSGERSELGDIVLRPTIEVLGEVVDSAGNPVVGARVRLAQVHPAWLDLGAGLRGESCVLFSVVRSERVSALPGWLDRLLARFPVPTTRTDGQGRFRLPTAPEGSASLLIDHPGFEPLVLPEAQYVGGTRLITGRLEISRGRALAGRVVDSRGEPVPGVEVFGGATHAPRELLAVLQPGGTTDEEGRFQLHGVPSAGAGIVAVRRGPADGWTIARQVEDEIEVVLPDPGAARVAVTNLEGEPLSRVELRVVPEPSGGLAFGHVPYEEPEVEISEGEPGIYHLEGLPHGRYAVHGRLEGFWTDSCRLEVNTELVEASLVLAPARSVDVQVLDGATGEPVVRAEVETFIPRTVGSPRFWVRTDRDGRCRLETVAGEELPHETWILVRHPGFCDHLAPLKSGQSGVECRLGQGGALSAILHVGEDPPPGPLALRIYAFEPHRGGLLTRPIQALTDARGCVRVEGLAPGRYMCHVDEPFATRNPLWSLTPQVKERAGALGGVSFMIREGEATELEIELAPSAGRGDVFGARGRQGRALTSWLELGHNQTIYLDGKYEPLDEGRSRLPIRMSREVVNQRGIRRRETVFFLRPDRTGGSDPARELTLEVHLASSPAAWTWIALEGLDEASRYELIVRCTDRSGVAIVTVEGSGRYRVKGRLAEGGLVEGEVFVEAGRWPQRVEVELY